MSDTARAYLAEHKVQEKIAAAVASTLTEMPADPLAAIGRRLLQESETQQEAAMLAEIATMTGPEGFDFLIVCCSNQAAENFWQTRLEATAKQVTGAAGVVLCVHEDWNGGAGNGLGTLYAFQKAQAKGLASGVDLAAAMRGGASVALYHTAGKGTRLAPLPGAENNNKPGVKLPALLKVSGEEVPITVLECVMRQTSSYAPARKGRCSVFWGDQIFVPSCGILPSSAPADILAALRPMPTREEWEAEELHQYGLIAVDARGSATQLEKVPSHVPCSASHAHTPHAHTPHAHTPTRPTLTRPHAHAAPTRPRTIYPHGWAPAHPHAWQVTYDVAMAYLPPDVTSVGTSLGSFSVSAALMDALLAEFAAELAEKVKTLDSDPHFWMPLTLKRADYLAVMEKKGVPTGDSSPDPPAPGTIASRLLCPVPTCPSPRRPSTGTDNGSWCCSVAFCLPKRQTLPTGRPPQPCLV